MMGLLIMMISLRVTINLRTLLRGRGGGAHGHALVLALAHLHVSKGATGCLRPSARPEGSFFANLTKRVSIVKLV